MGEEDRRIDSPISPTPATKTCRRTRRGAICTLEYGAPSSELCRAVRVRMSPSRPWHRKQLVHQDGRAVGRSCSGFAAAEGRCSLRLWRRLGHSKSVNVTQLCSPPLSARASADYRTGRSHESPETARSGSSDRWLDLVGAGLPCATRPTDANAAFGRTSGGAGRATTSNASSSCAGTCRQP